ncbi:MAG TPA: CdaR family protein [Geopsychrobacteraceae bacterium]|nr:CdaR family protein [Geopsychrobacteraceae bacterium]
MLRLVTENWTLKLTSLVFAMALWMFIMGERRLEVGYAIPLHLQNVPASLMVANEVPSLVDVRISGPRTLLLKVNPSDMSIAVDLADLKPGLTTFKRLEEKLDIPSGLRVTRLSPSFIDIKLERIREKRVPIKVVLRGEPPPGYRVAGLKAIPEQALIEGAEKELKRVSEVTTEAIDLDGIVESFTLIVPLLHEGTYTRFKDEKTTEVTVEIEALDLPEPEVEDNLEGKP